MHLPREYVAYMAKQVLQRLRNQKLIEYEQPEYVTEVVTQVMLDEVGVEDRLNDEVRKILEEHGEEMKRMSEIFRGRILDVTENTYTIELTGTGAKLDAFIGAIEPSAILETVRTGASGMARGERVLRV